MSARSRRRKKPREHGRTAPAQVPAADPSPDGSPETREALVAAARSALAAGDTKRAVDRAKALCAQAPGESSEGLLAEAYVARILSLKGGAADADALLETARARCPSSRLVFDRLALCLDARFARIDALLRSAPAHSEEAALPAEVADAIRKELTDPDSLASASALAPSHPLRCAAAALKRAFDSVTSGPVAPDDLVLAEVSRRSPLAAWKPLVRAIAAFHAGDDVECERQLAAVPPDSAAARLVPALRAMTSADPGAGHAEPFAELRAGIQGGFGALREALVQVDERLSRKKRGGTLQAIRQAVHLCGRERPDLLEELRQRLSIRCFLANIPAERERAALGGPVARSARFWRLCARAFEAQGDVVGACALWEQFRRSAVDEGWFPSKGPEAAALYLRMTELLSHFDASTLEKAREEVERGRAGGVGIHQLLETPPGADRSDAYYLSPHRLFQRACFADPRRENHRRWLEWARLQKNWKPADEAAGIWHAADPTDPQPLLHLVESCERRNAHHEALRILAKAEARAGLSPEVGCVRPRLLAATAVKQLQAKKPWLAVETTQALANLEQAQQGKRPALVAALRWACSISSRDDRHAVWQAQVEELVGRPLTGQVVLSALARACRLPSDQVPPLLPGLRRVKPVDLCAAVADASLLAADLKLPIPLPEAWSAHLEEGLSRTWPGLDAVQLRGLGETALRAGLSRVAFSAAGAGLRLSGANVGEFLLLRARSLPETLPGRVANCLQVAGTLARRQGNLSLLAEIQAHGKGLLSGSVRGDLPASAIDAVLEREKRRGPYPKRGVLDDDPVAPCNCRACRGAGVDGPPRSDAGVLDDDAFFEPAPDDFVGGLPPLLQEELLGLPPELLEPLLELSATYGMVDPPDPDELQRRDPSLHARLMDAVGKYMGFGGALPGQGRRSRRSRRKRK